MNKMNKNDVSLNPIWFSSRIYACFTNTTLLILP